MRVSPSSSEVREGTCYLFSPPVNNIWVKLLQAFNDIGFHLFISFVCLGLDMRETVTAQHGENKYTNIETYFTYIPYMIVHKK